MKPPPSVPSPSSCYFKENCADDHILKRTAVPTQEYEDQGCSTVARSSSGPRPWLARISFQTVPALHTALVRPGLQPTCLPSLANLWLVSAWPN